MPEKPPTKKTPTGAGREKSRPDQSAYQKGADWHRQCRRTNASRRGWLALAVISGFPFRSPFIGKMGRRKPDITTLKRLDEKLECQPVSPSCIAGLLID